MGFLILPILVGVMLVPDPGPSEERLADFSRIARATNESVYLVDRDGHERLMTLVEATDDNLTLMIGPQTLTMAKDAVLRVDRQRDRTIDGILKGAAFGLLAGLTVQQGLDRESVAFVFQAMAIYGGIGYFFDRANSERAPLYRAPGGRVAASVKVRF